MVTSGYTKQGGKTTRSGGGGATAAGEGGAADSLDANAPPPTKDQVLAETDRMQRNISQQEARDFGQGGPWERTESLGRDLIQNDEFKKLSADDQASTLAQMVRVHNSSNFTASSNYGAGREGEIGRAIANTRNIQAEYMYRTLNGRQRDAVSRAFSRQEGGGIDIPTARNPRISRMFNDMRRRNERQVRAEAVARQRSRNSTPRQRDEFDDFFDSL